MLPPGAWFDPQSNGRSHGAGSEMVRFSLSNSFQQLKLRIRGWKEAERSGWRLSQKSRQKLEQEYYLDLARK